MDLNKHIVKSDNHKPFHSNGYAIVANGDRIGSTANISYSQRQQLMNGRKIVGNYNRSTIGRSYSVVRPKAIDSAAVTTNKQPIAQPKRFNEPARRPYSPYS